jgi:predicted amidohydrolase
MEATLVRVLGAAAAQMGRTQKADLREHTLARTLKLLEEAARGGASLAVFPELAFTTFFPRWLLEGETLERYFERGMPNPAVQALFDRAHVGYAGRTPGWSPLQLRNPGRLRRRHSRPLSQGAFCRARAHYQQLEKRYFEYSDLGFHSTQVRQANASMNATRAISVAKAGEEDGSGLIGGSCDVDPNGRIVAQAESLAEEVIADIDVDLCRQGKDKMFNFAAHRRPEQYANHRTRRRRRAGHSRHGFISTRPVTALPKELT